MDVCLFLLDFGTVPTVGYSLLHQLQNKRCVFKKLFYSTHINDAVFRSVFHQKELSDK